MDILNNELFGISRPEDEDNLWKGVVKGRKSGLFDPSDTVTYLGPYMLPPSACDSSTHCRLIHERACNISFFNEGTENQ